MGYSQLFACIIHQISFSLLSMHSYALQNVLTLLSYAHTCDSNFYLLMRHPSSHPPTQTSVPSSTTKSCQGCSAGAYNVSVYGPKQLLPLFTLSQITRPRSWKMAWKRSHLSNVLWLYPLLWPLLKQILGTWYLVLNYFKRVTALYVSN